MHRKPIYKPDMANAGRVYSLTEMAGELGVSRNCLSLYLAGYPKQFKKGNPGRYTLPYEEIPAILAHIEKVDAARAARKEARRVVIPKFYGTGDLGEKAGVTPNLARRFVFRRNGPPDYPKASRRFDANELEELAGELRALAKKHPRQPLRGYVPPVSSATPQSQGAAPAHA